MVQLYRGEPKGHSFVLEEDGYEITPFHPGRLIKRWLDANPSRSILTLSLETGVSSQTINNILDGAGDIDDAIARNLSRVFGKETAETLFRMQVAFNSFKHEGVLPKPESLPVLHF